ncbi:DegQ family serine endoprotease [Alcaligenes endophyticus]|uniref:Probable periplasmic serine endoprotease DegP-like n=1 Tax=Alcaligenes endophyticus TaxID=1929088 RepID=A0ABT8EHR7_9BURK|nr:DegQ family serine endoprotease [Alcaligenes endophyticus]MCX5592179.1 DegQ family serine endoprotease [Alcaligenes endophyticus]MDN4120826.1 DegQ family serine endoprotease [Alcaligenes endophyticus]
MENKNVIYKSLIKALAATTTGVMLSLVAPAQTALAQDVAAIAAEVGLPDFTKVVERTESGVVNIRTTESVPVRRPMSGGPGGDPYDMFRWFFGPDFAPPGVDPRGPRGQAPGVPDQQERTVPRGVGSGFIISDDGYILTNNHVVANANGIFVTLTDGKEYPAKIIGTDERTDVALIKIEAKNLPALKIGDSNTLKKGQWVLAIGSPFGLESTVTSGIVSAINRDTGDYLPFIQTDVAVNPGNSGGPLINLSGEVVGVNSQIVSRSGGFMGISLAIPIDEAMRVVEQLKAHGRVTRGRIGVQITPVAEDVAKALGLTDSKGALVSSVEENGPAAKAGIQAGDVILKFDGKKIDQMSDLPRIVGSVKPGENAPAEVWRKGKAVNVKIQVEEMPSNDAKPTPTASKDTAPSETDALGLSVEAVSPEELKRLGVPSAVRVVQAGEPASGVGLQNGDIILRINDSDVGTLAQYGKLVAGLDKSKPAAVLVLRSGQSQWVLITPAK